MAAYNERRTIEDIVGRVLAQACAGNFHVSLEPRQVMRLGRGSDGKAKGSAALAAALAQAMDRDDDDV